MMAIFIIQCAIDWSSRHGMRNHKRRKDVQQLIIEPVCIYTSYWFTRGLMFLNKCWCFYDVSSRLVRCFMMFKNKHVKLVRTYTTFMLTWHFTFWKTWFSMRQVQDCLFAFPIDPMCFGFTILWGSFTYISMFGVLVCTLLTSCDIPFRKGLMLG